MNELNEYIAVVYDKRLKIIHSSLIQVYQFILIDIYLFEIYIIICILYSLLYPSFFYYNPIFILLFSVPIVTPLDP